MADKRHGDEGWPHHVPPATATPPALITVDAEWWAVCSLRLPTRALTRHRLTAERYRALRAQYHGVCALCSRGNFYANQPAPLFIDHDHLCCPDHHNTCGSCVRGLLCSGCNGWLGALELWGKVPGLNDDGNWLRAAVAYLDRAGCALTADRKTATVALHHRKVALWDPPCTCRVCDPGWEQRRAGRRARGLSRIAEARSR
ncbi:endonuclease domain-containing protein [Micromonospora sp. NPDC049645]|uniref:endonuclease domain-containing protein n=1 Tax=Micromonospora sp. NPDC049645 TaxID=3155508 RepID=UPI00344AA8A7